MVEQTIRMALHAGTFVNRIAGKHVMTAITKLFRKIIPSFPLWTSQITAPPSLQLLKTQTPQVVDPAAKTIVYFPTCISRVLGNSAAGKKNIMDTFMQVAQKAHIHVKVAAPLQGICCGQIFSSKGFAEAYAFTANKTVEQLWDATQSALYPVVTDISSCAYTLHNLRAVLNAANREKYDRLHIMDSVDYLHTMVLPGCGTGTKKQDIVLHPVCSLEKMGTHQKFIQIAEKFADRVTVPKHAGCCGMAGDRGFLFPELTASASLAETQEVCSSTYEGYYSSTKTCEMAVSEAVQANYESILYLVNEVLI